MMFLLVSSGVTSVADPGLQTTSYVTAKAVALTSSGAPATSYVVVNPPLHGAANISGNTLTYTPASLYAGSDAITVAAIGPGGIQGPSTVISYSVAEPPDPVFVAPSALSISSVAPSTTTIDLASYITNPFTSVVVTTPPAHGVVSITGSVLSYTPTQNYAGGDTVGVTIYGPGTNVTVGIVSYSVTAVAAPVVANATMSTAHATALAIPITITGSWTSLAVLSISDGSYTVSGSTITYTPSGNTAAFSTTITYRATGPGGNSNIGSATVSVAAYDPYPVGATQTVTYTVRNIGSKSKTTVFPGGSASVYDLIQSILTDENTIYGDLEGAGNFRPFLGNYGSTPANIDSSGRSFLYNNRLAPGLVYDIPVFGAGVATQFWRINPASVSPLHAGVSITPGGSVTGTFTAQRIS